MSEGLNGSRCPRCEGTGDVWVSRPMIGFHRENCQDCGGSGVIRKVPEVKPPILTDMNGKDTDLDSLFGGGYAK